MTSSPRTAYQQTQHFLREMRSATQLDDLAHAWEQFLIYHQRTWNKCEAHYRGRSFWGPLLPKYSAIRKSDPVLVYVQQARHVDEHGIRPITQTQPGFTAIGRGTITGVSKITGGGAYTLGTGSTAQVTVNPATVVAEPVTNRQVIFAPPILNSKPNPPVLLIAEEAIKFYDALFTDISAAGGD